MKTFDTVAKLKLAKLKEGQFVETGGYYAKGDAGAARYLIVIPRSSDGYGDHELANGNIAVLQVVTEANVKQFGAKGDDTHDDEGSINAAAKSGADSVFIPAGRYKTTQGIEPLNGVVLKGDGYTKSIIKYYGGSTAISLGENPSVLNYGCGVSDIKIELVDKAAKGINLRATAGAVLRDLSLEGLYQPFDNTRTNLGVHIDGSDASSFFNRLENVMCNHMHESFRIQTTGSLHATTQYFLNCTALGDQSTDDASIGYNIGNGGIHNQEGQGSVITGGNVELCNTGFLLGNRAGSLTIDGVRTEINITGTAWKFDFVDGCDPCTLKGINGLGTSYMEANSGIRNFDSNAHMLLSDDKGSMRLNGFDSPLNAKTFIGIGGASSAIYSDANADFKIGQNVANSTGRIAIQAGYGSAAAGGYSLAYGHNHSSLAGYFICGASSGAGNFEVRSGYGAGATQLACDGASTRAGLDNVFGLGSGSFRWTQIYAANGTINTSDATAKTEPKPVTDKVLDAWSDVEFCSFKMLDAVEKKGESKARIHFGVIAQQVKQVFEEAGLNAFDYALLCLDEWEDQYRDVPETYTGKVIMVEGKETQEVDVPAHTELVQKAGSRYGIRYEEALILEAALMRRELNKLKG